MRLFILIFFFCSVYGFSQNKFEKESRLKVDKVPKKAVDFIAQCNFDRKVKWFLEESQDGKTIEAKSCKRNYKFSVEFDSDGNILDVEKTIKWKEIPDKSRQEIEATLGKRFKKYRIKKVQIHWKVDQDLYLDLIKGKNQNKVNELYEIVLKGKENKSTNLFELLINAKGVVLKELQFAPANTVNLEF